MRRKRVALIILAVLPLFLISSGVASGFAEQGDCNYDGNITAVDAEMALQMAVGKIAVDLIADVNEDNEITSYDAATILQVAVGRAVIPYRTAAGVYMNPVSQKVEPGQDITLNMEIEPLDWGVSAAEISLEFDPAALEATSLEPGDFLGDTPLVGLNETDNEAGILRLAVARVGETTAPSPQGVIVIVAFTVLETAESGTYELTMAKVRLTDETFEDIADIQVQGASIEVIR